MNSPTCEKACEKACEKCDTSTEKTLPIRVKIFSETLKDPFTLETKENVVRTYIGDYQNNHVAMNEDVETNAFLVYFEKTYYEDSLEESDIFVRCRQKFLINKFHEFCAEFDFVQIHVQANIIDLIFEDNEIITLHSYFYNSQYSLFMKKKRSIYNTQMIHIIRKWFA